MVRAPSPSPQRAFTAKCAAHRSPDGLDYVLTGKMKTAVCVCWRVVLRCPRAWLTLPDWSSDSVNARIRLDTDPGATPNQPTITYDQFVEDLDLGDSFTSVLFECLVKVSIASFLVRARRLRCAIVSPHLRYETQPLMQEMAERRKRKSTSDKRMISRRTQKLLQNLSHPTRVLRDRSDESRLAFRRNMYGGPGWGAVDLEGPTDDFASWISDLPDDSAAVAGRPAAAASAAPPPAGDDSDDMWTEDALDAHLSPPSTRELHDSYYPFRPSDGPGRSTRWPVLARPALETATDWTLPAIYRTPSTTGNPPGSMSTGNTQGPASASGATVTRQASLRRTGRQRLDAFNDFATRRRLNTRLDAETSTASDRAEAASALAAYHAGAAAAINRGATWDAAPPPWTVGAESTTTGTVTSSSRALSGNSRLRRLQQLQAQAQAHAAAAASAASASSSSVPSSVAGTPDPSGIYLLRSVSPTPAPTTGPAVASRGVGTGESGEMQLLTPRSTTPTEDVVSGPTTLDG